MPANLENSVVPQYWKRSAFLLPILQKGNAKCLNYSTIALISHASKVMLKKCFKLGFSSMWTENFQMYKLDLEEAEEHEIKLPTSAGSQKKQWNCKKFYFYFTDYTKAFDCVDHNKLWNMFDKMGIPCHFTCLLRNLYAWQEAIVGTGHRTMDWFQIGKGVLQSCLLLPCLYWVHYRKCWAGSCTSWNQDCQKYQQPQIYKWNHPNGRK